MDNFLTMTRKQLQALCKKHGVPANLKNAEMAERLSLLIEDKEAQATEQSASGEFENAKVKVKKKVRFHLENDVYEFVDTYMEAVEQEQAEARRERASRRSLRKNGLTKVDKDDAVETSSNESKQVRLTRSRKSAVIVSPPPRKRAKTGGKAATESGDKECSSNSDVVDSVQTNAGKAKEFDETFVAGNGETVGRISGLAEVNMPTSLDSEIMDENKSAAEVSGRRTLSQRKFKVDDTLITRSDDATRQVIEHDVLTVHRVSVHDEVPLRKSCRVAMKNISNMPENQKRGSAGVLEKQEKKRPKNESPVVIPDSNESFTLAREEEENANQLKEDHILGKPLRRSTLSTSTSTTVAGLDVDSSKENQRTCGTLVVKLPMVKPLRRSRRKKYGNDALGLSDVSSLHCDSSHKNQPLKQTRTTETECCNEAITSNVIRNYSESNLLVDPGWLSNKLDCEKRHHKRIKRLARLEKGDSRSTKSFPGKNDLLNETGVSELNDVNSDRLLSITVDKNGICSDKIMTPSGSEIHDDFMEACVLTSATLLVKEPTICSVEEASVTNLTKSISVPAVGESQITVCDSDVLQRETLTADPVQRSLEFEEPDNLMEFSNSVSYDLPHAGCTRDEVSMEVGEKHAHFDDKHDCDSSSETRISQGAPIAGVPDQDASNSEEATIVLYKSPTEGKDAQAIVDSGTQNPNTSDHLNGVSQDLSKELTSEYMENNELSLYYSKTSQSEEILASCSPKAAQGNLPSFLIELEDFSCTNALNKTPCPEIDLVDQAIVSSTEAINECNIDDQSMGKKDRGLNTSIVNRVKQSIAEVMNEDEVYKTIPELGNRLHYAPGNLDDAEEFSVDFLNCNDAEPLLMRTENEAVSYKARTETGDLMPVDSNACDEYTLQDCTDNKEIIESKDSIISYNNAGMAKESTSCVESHSFDKLDELLREIDDYFEWRNSEEKVLEGNATSDDTKEKTLNLNVETLVEVAIKTDSAYGRHVHINECKCDAGIDEEVYAAPSERHGEQSNDIAAYDQVGDLIIRDGQVDHHEDILEERCSEEQRLSGYESGRTYVNSPDVIQTSPYQSVICTGLQDTCSTKKTLAIDSRQSVTGIGEVDAKLLTEDNQSSMVSRMVNRENYNVGSEDAQFEHFARDSVEENTVLSQGILKNDNAVASATSSNVRDDDSLVFNNSSCQSVSNESCDGNPQKHETDMNFLDTTTGQAVHDGNCRIPASPYESTSGLLSNIDVDALTSEKDVHNSVEQNANVNSVNDEKNCDSIMGALNPPILSSSNCEKTFEPSHGLVAQESTSLETNNTLDTHLSNKVGDKATVQQHIAKIMKENVTPFSKTESIIKCSKPASKRRRVLDNLRNN